MYRLPPYLQQVKVLNNLYTAACDSHQLTLAAVPKLSKRMTITRRISNESKEWQKIEMECLHNLTRFPGITATHTVFTSGQSTRRSRGRRRRHSKSVAGGRRTSRLRVFENSAVDLSRNERERVNISQDSGENEPDPGVNAPVVTSFSKPKVEPSGQKDEKFHGT